MAQVESLSFDEIASMPSLEILGEHPLAKDAKGRLCSRIGTIFPGYRALVTLPGIHATQRMAFVDLLNRRRQENGLAPLAREDVTDLWMSAVDLVMDRDTLLIRPNPDNMALAFKADDLLQELIPKHRIKFLYLLNAKVRDAIKRRGECWRITPLPTSADEMMQMISSARIGIFGNEIYYHNRNTGTRYLTYQEFAALANLGDEELRQYLLEIQEFSPRRNAHGYPEIDFFETDDTFSHVDLLTHDFRAMEPAPLRTAFEGLRERFEKATLPAFRADLPNSSEWRNRMFARLLASKDEVISEETLLGLSSEFFMQIEWLPGGRIEKGELILDPVYEFAQEHANDESLQRFLDEKPRKFIFNFVREYGDLQYFNIGRVIGSLSRRPAFYGRRDVYIAEVKQRGSDKEIVSIIRMQKWAVREHLESGKDLLNAMIQSEEYTEYILDRRLGCRQLGMNLPTRVTAKRISENYYPQPSDPHSAFVIWTPYFEREYIRGIATDKLPHYKLANEEYALRCAQLLGRAAAPNLIVGRCDRGGNPLFDDGDEVLIEDESAMPIDIVVADHTGTFADYVQELSYYAKDYAEPVNRRAADLPNPKAFAEAYLDAFADRYNWIKSEYRKRRKAFDTLFRHRRRDEGGSFSYRWECVLRRLEANDGEQLADHIRQCIVLP
jgi:hypothetical protein